MKPRTGLARARGGGGWTSVHINFISIFSNSTYAYRRRVVVGGGKEESIYTALRQQQWRYEKSEYLGRHTAKQRATESTYGTGGCVVAPQHSKTQNIPNDTKGRNTQRAPIKARKPTELAHNTNKSSRGGQRGWTRCGGARSPTPSRTGGPRCGGRP